MLERNQTAQLAADFNNFYLRVTLPDATQIGAYVILEEIGEGAFGKVYLAQHAILNVKVVLKCGKIDDPNIVREVYYHRQLRHKNIVKLYEVIKTEAHLWLALEYCEGNELFYYIYEKRRLEPEACQLLFHQIVEGIKYVHLLNLAHRDLKLENILLADKKRAIVKLTDFGFVREFNPYRKTFLLTVCGTTAYMAPEVLLGEKYLGFAIDVWSMGVILYAMLHGELPFDDDSDIRTKEKIITEEPVYGLFVNKDTVALLRRMLSKDPALRPTITEILNSPFLIDITNKHADTRPAPVTDAESVMSISQHYKLNRPPFQLKTEKRLLARMEKLNVDVDLLQLAVFSGQFNSLTAFYELALTREYQRKKSRYLRKKRYYEAKRQLRKSRKRVRSALSLTDQSLLLPLEKRLLSMSITSRPELRLGSGGGSGSRKSTEELRKPHSSRNSIRRSFSQNRDTFGTTSMGATLVPLGRQVSFFPEDSKSVASSDIPSKKGRRILGKLQFWKRNKDDRATSLTSSGSEPSELDDKIVVEKQGEPPVVPALEPPISNGHQRDDSLQSQLSETPQMTILDSFTRRKRPESMVSQISQLSQLSHPMSESELDSEDDDVDVDDVDVDFDEVYELSINLLQHDLRPIAKKPRPQPTKRAASDSLVLLASTTATRKRFSLLQVLTNLLDESSSRFRSEEVLRPSSPKQKRRGAHPKLRPSRSSSLVHSNGTISHPLPISAIGNGIVRPSSPPVQKMKNGVMKPLGIEKRDFDSVQVDRWRENGTPLMFKSRINQIAEEDED